MDFIFIFNLIFIVGGYNFVIYGLYDENVWYVVNVRVL